MLVLCWVILCSQVVSALSDSVSTYGGNANGAPCVFPHKYGYRTYSKCHRGLIGGKSWCCTVANCGYWFAKKWGYCQEKNDFPKWNHLSVTFKKFDAIPMSEENAKEKKWTLIADNCADTSGPFHGSRYMLNGEHATILIFDVHGHIAGMQMAFKTDLKKKGKYGKYAGALQEIQEKDEKYYYITAYFTDPKKVCDKKVQRAKDVIGDKLVFLAGKDNYIEAPLLRKDTAGTKWELGKCFIGMGTHYWYDISNDMDCDDLFPFFLMYKKQQLTGWGYATDIMVGGKRVEHPPSFLIGMFFKKKTLPQCLKELDARSTQHVYFTKVGWFTHTCIF